MLGSTQQPKKTHPKAIFIIWKLNSNILYGLFPSSRVLRRQNNLLVLLFFLLLAVSFWSVISPCALGMPCFVPFDNKKLDVSFFAFRPTGVFADELIDAVKYFSFHAEDLGCVYSSVLRSIHGNMIVWYGAWLRRSPDNRKMLNDALLSVLEEVSTMGVLLHHGFFEAFFGESKDGSSLAKFSSGDTIFLSAMASTPRDVADLSYACLALHRTFFAKTDGLSAGVHLRCNDQPVVAALMVWKSLHACYSWLLRSDYRNTILPYFSHLSQDAQFDVFKVVYVNRDEILNVSPFPPRTIGGGDGEE